MAETQKKTLAKKADAPEKHTGKPVKNEAISKGELKKRVTARLSTHFGVTPENATEEQLYNALALTLRDLMLDMRREFEAETDKQQGKQVYYLCMEFLMGRSLKNTLYNLGLTDAAASLAKAFGTKLERLYELEPDAGLGNGGLGRLAACFMDSLTSLSIPAMGYSILYEYGIFRQKLIDGWQTELPDFWLPGGECWLRPRPDLTKTVCFEGNISDWWDESGYHFVKVENQNSVYAVPYDLCVSGKGGKAVNILRLWSAKKSAFNMELFNTGDYLRASEQSAMAETISKVLYPADNHHEGKSLRLRQQYFLVSSTIQDIVETHMAKYKTADNLPDQVAIHINDTHPALVVPELMRILLDDCGYPWDKAWDIVCRTVAYTNHTVMPEALECWSEDLFARLLPRVYQITVEINKRFVEELSARFPGDWNKIDQMAVIHGGAVRMANLCACACHHVNGVSPLHSQILKDRLFSDFYLWKPEKFGNVTNGIAHRRWLCQSNPRLTALLTDLIGDGFVNDGEQLLKLKDYEKDESVKKELLRIKQLNKADFAEHIRKQQGIVLDSSTIFDVQVKRLHEYKRQHLNALNILTEYLRLKEDPSTYFAPRTYIFAAKAAPGYYMAKNIIRMICNMGKLINEDPDVAGRIKVVYLEDYNVTMAERLMPAADFSEQISLAGTEASGTGNMKLMINGAVTIGTLDGANVEMREAVGDDNILIFGMTSEEVDRLKALGYDPHSIVNANPMIRRALDLLDTGFSGLRYGEIANAIRDHDTYMVLADFESYRATRQRSAEIYANADEFARMSLNNIATAGRFAADRAIRDYCRDIWGVK